MAEIMLSYRPLGEVGRRGKVGLLTKPPCNEEDSRVAEGAINGSAPAALLAELARLHIRP